MQKSQTVKQTDTHTRERGKGKERERENKADLYSSISHHIWHSSHSFEEKVFS